MKLVKRIIPERILILCEGQSEVKYLQKAQADIPDKEKRLSLTVDILKSKYSNCEGLVKDAIERMKNAKDDKIPYHTVWVVFDNDRQEEKKAGSLSNAFQTAKTKGIQIAYSSISWEYWYLLHFDFTTRGFANSSEVIKELKKYNGFKNYVKPYPEAWQILKPHLSTGKEHAKRVRQHHLTLSQNAPSINPWADVDILITTLFHP